MAFVSAIIVAGGSSRRMGSTDKLLLKIGQKTVIERSTAAFCENALVDEVIIVASEGNLARITELCGALPKVAAVVTGGATRALSVQKGVAAASREADYYAIHDGARPFASDGLITRVIEAAFEYGAAAPAVRMTDTVKEVDGTGAIVRTLERGALVAVATPQVVEAAAYRAACEGCDDAFDDCQPLERAGCRVVVVQGERDNIKITEPDDADRARLAAGESSMRIGHGYDVHRLVEGRRLILGGVEIPHETGLLGHSDADVVCHAAADALLGAAALPDIGAQFPDSDAAYKDADSLALLARAAELVGEAGWRAANVDVTVICQAPRLREHIGAMRANLARALGVETSAVNVKATTEEGLGFSGAKEGIAAHAVALIRQK